MIGYIIGLLLGVVVLVLQNLKPTSVGFRVMSLILSVVLIWGIYYAHLNYWNLPVIPIGIIVACFISAFCFPYRGISAYEEYMHTNGRNYYAELKDNDAIGEVECYGFKQTYDRIMGGIITDIVTTQDEFQKLGDLLYSKNFYPISTHTKHEVMQHITSAIEKVSIASKHEDSIRRKANDNIELLFNTYVSVMSIHEEATKRLEEINSARKNEV